MASESRSAFIQSQGVHFTPFISQVISKKKKPKRKMRKQRSNGNGVMYSVVTEVANASSSLTFGHLIRDDSNNATASISRLLTCGARVCKGFIAAVTAPRTHPVVSRLSLLEFRDTRREPS